MSAAPHNTCVAVGQLVVPSPCQEVHPYSIPQLHGDLARDEAVILKRSATPTLLGIDLDIRIQILDLLLLNRTRRITENGRCMLVDVLLDNAVQRAKDITLGSTFPKFERGQRACSSIQSGSSDFWSSIASVQILRVCG